MHKSREVSLLNIQPLPLSETLRHILRCNFIVEEALLKAFDTHMYDHYYPYNQCKEGRFDVPYPLSSKRHVLPLLSLAHLLQHVIEQFRDSALFSIQTIGCGSGYSVALLKALGYDAYGCESDLQGIQHTRKELVPFIYHGTLKELFKSPTVLPHVLLFEGFVDSDVLQFYQNHYPLTHCIGLLKTHKNMGRLAYYPPKTSTPLLGRDVVGVSLPYEKKEIFVL
jgi:hypothetical protein